MFIHCFKTILVFQWILQSCDGVLVSQENSQVAIQSDKKVDLPISPASLHNFLQVFLSVFLWFYFHLFHLVCCIRPRKRVVVVPPNFLQCRWCLCRIGVWSATFDLYKRLCPRREDLKLVQESSGQKFCPLPEIWFKGKWVGFIQLIETVVFVNTPCKQKVFLLVWNQHLHHRSLTAKALEKMMPGRLIRFPFGGFVGLFSGANSC